MPTDDRYRVELTAAAQKDLSKLKQNQAAALSEIAKLEADPLLGHPLKGSLKGVRALEFSLKGSGVYRAAYIVDEHDLVCIIFIVGPHQNIYRDATKRLKALNKSGGLLRF